jgi:hypothetical protein
MSWIKQLEELEKTALSKAMAARQDDEDEDDGADYEDDDEGGEEEAEAPVKPVKKGISGVGNTEPKTSKQKGCYPPAESGEDDNEPGDSAQVHDPKSLDRKTKGKRVRFGKGTQKSLADGLTDEAADAIEVSDVLGELTKSIEALAGAQDEEIATLAGEVAAIKKSVNAIGSALVTALTTQNEIAKSLGARVEEVESAPVGRRSVRKGVERKFAPNDGTAEPVTYAGIMNKAMVAFKAGKLSTLDITKLECDLQKGVVNPAVMAKLNAAE